jgi:hypothetical protein
MADENLTTRTVCGYCGTWRSSPCGEGCYWNIARAKDGSYVSCREGRERCAVDGVECECERTEYDVR